MELMRKPTKINTKTNCVITLDSHLQTSLILYDQVPFQHPRNIHMSEVAEPSDVNHYSYLPVDLYLFGQIQLE